MQVESTVLMSLFWKEKPAYLEDALLSLYNQTVLPDEILLVCEGTLPEELIQILHYYETTFPAGVLRWIDAGDAKGLPACLNVGLAAAKGKYIFRFDTDDICLPERIERQLEFLHQHPETALLSAPVDEYDLEMKEMLGVRQVPQSHEEIVKMAKWRSPFCHPVTVYLRDVALSLGGYPLVSAAEDYAFFSLFLVKGYKAANMPTALVKARTGKDFTKRRKGARFLKGELASHAFINKIGFHSNAVYYFHVVSKTILRNLPDKLLLTVYKKFVRSK
ncbi:glycosyltransferase [Chitinophaga sp. sic0106]|uniref:glycosyltransferase n=1 Tax=Chitinophaga sp. sic0106 TaxID=2854785 RepID=UPI001C45E736|nr:glycosyltransferase [Chitinophaga sp. sic0106]MBV7529006.1 glycosyltransferase [Chitinophaga sp. sic0106]